MWEMKNRNRLLEDEKSDAAPAVACLARGITRFPLVTESCRRECFRVDDLQEVGIRHARLPVQDKPGAHLVNTAFDLYGDDPAPEYPFFEGEHHEKAS